MNNIKRWLEFLIANNLLYIKHTIDDNILNVMREKGLVLEMLPMHNGSDENSINDTSSFLNCQEIYIYPLTVFSTQN